MNTIDIIAAIFFSIVTALTFIWLTATMSIAYGLFGNEKQQKFYQAIFTTLPRKFIVRQNIFNYLVSALLTWSMWHIGLERLAVVSCIGLALFLPVILAQCALYRKAV